MFPKIYREVGAEDTNFVNQLLLNAVSNEVVKTADAVKTTDFIIVLTVISQYSTKRQLEYKTTFVWESSIEAEDFFVYNETDDTFVLAENAKLHFREEVDGGFCEYDGENVTTTQKGGRYFAQAAIASRTDDVPDKEVQDHLLALARTALAAFAVWLTMPGRSEHLYAIDE